MSAESKRVHLREGDRVEGNYRGRGKWYAGKITRDRDNGTFDIAYDDGETESRVAEENIRAVLSAASSSSSSASL